MVWCTYLPARHYTSHILGIKYYLSNFSCRKKDMNFNVFNSSIHCFSFNNRNENYFSSLCTFSSPVCSAKDSIYLRISLVFLAALYMHIISPSVQSEAISGWICTFQHTYIPRRVWIIPYTNHLMLRVLSLF